MDVSIKYANNQRGINDQSVGHHTPDGDKTKSSATEFVIRLIGRVDGKDVAQNPKNHCRTFPIFFKPFM